MHYNRALWSFRTSGGSNEQSDAYLKKAVESNSLKEERAEAKAEGRIEKAREAICKFMVRRFGADTGKVTEKVQRVASLEILDKLMEELFAANTLEEAQTIIKSGIAGSLQ